MDTRFVVRNAIATAGLLGGIGLAVAAFAVSSVPWWLFFFGMIVLAVTDSVAKTLAARVAGSETGDQRVSGPV